MIATVQNLTNIVRQSSLTVAGRGRFMQTALEYDQRCNAERGRRDSAVSQDLIAWGRELLADHFAAPPSGMHLWLADELAGLNVGGISKPRVVEGGVSMLAVCSKTSARDTTFIKNNLRQQAGSEAMKTEAAEYLANLRSKARIVYN